MDEADSSNLSSAKVCACAAMTKVGTSVDGCSTVQYSNVSHMLCVRAESFFASHVSSHLGVGCRSCQAPSKLRGSLRGHRPKAEGPRGRKKEKEKGKGGWN